MTQFESILNQKKNYNKIDYIKEEAQYYWNKILDTIFYKPWYWFRCHFIPKHRYHILDLTKGGNGYSYGWRDTDTRMLQACFLLLVEYVECEKPFDVADWDWNDKHKEVAAEIKELYDWWKVGRSAKRAALIAEWDATGEQSQLIPLEDGGYTIQVPESHKILNKKEDELEEEDQRNLERLIKIRGWLWT
jgi:hypothetical protein